MTAVHARVDRPYRRLAIAYLAILAAAVVWLAVQSDIDVTPTWFTTVLLGMATLLPAYFAWSAHEWDVVEPIYVFALVYFLQFGAGAISLQAFPPPVRFTIVDFVPRSELVALFGWLTFLPAYYGLRRGLRRRIPPRTEGVSAARTWDTGRLYVVIAVFLIVGWAARIYQIQLGAYFHVRLESELPSEQFYPIAFLANLPWFALIIWSLHAFTTRSARALRTLAILGLFELAYAIPTGSKEAVLKVCLAPVVAWALVHGSYRARTVLAAALLTLLMATVVITPLWYIYRNQPLYGKRLDDIPDGIGYVADTVSTMDPSEYLQLAVVTTAGRSAMIEGLAGIVYGTPDLVDFQNGATYAWSLALPIPRAIWPDKPDYGNFGNYFARTFDLIDPSDSSTNLAATLIGELYLNFGLAGVLLGMPLYGLIWYGAYAVWRRVRQVDPMTAALLFTPILWVLWFRFEDIFVLAIGGTSESVAFLFLTSLFLARAVGTLRSEPLARAALT